MTSRFFLLLGVCLCALSIGCSSDDTFAHPPPQALSGEWYAVDGAYELIFLPNNRFSLIEYGEDGGSTRLTGWAYYPAKGQVRIEFDQRLKVCPEVKGVYEFSRDGDELTFILVEDACEVRGRLLSRTWADEAGSGWF